MEGFVYILQSQKNWSYYVGSTINVANRLVEHNTGKTKSTRHLVPWKLMFYQSYPDITIAKRVEYKIKKLKSRKIIELIIQNQKISLGDSSVG